MEIKKIATDYDAIIRHNPDKFVEIIKSTMDKGVEVYITSHTEDGRKFARDVGAIDLSFIDSTSDQESIEQRKLQLCKQYKIDFFLYRIFDNKLVATGEFFNLKDW